MKCGRNWYLIDSGALHKRSNLNFKSKYVNSLLDIFIVLLIEPQWYETINHLYKYVINFDNFYYDKNIILTWFGLFFYLLHFLLYICDVSLGVIFPCFFLKVSYGFFCLIDRNTYKKSLETNHVKYFWDGFLLSKIQHFFLRLKKKYCLYSWDIFSYNTLYYI